MVYGCILLVMDWMTGQCMVNRGSVILWLQEEAWNIQMTWHSEFSAWQFAWSSCWAWSVL